MKYAYEDLSDAQFETLIVHLCQRLLGIGVQGFATGPDGGRDAKFIGTAELFPSSTGPWVGTTIIQAKHTIGYNKSFSETDFHSESSDSTILSEEIPRIKKLRESGELDHYMLFSNRRLTGNTDNSIRDYIAKECSLPVGSIYLCGLEQLETWLKRFPGIPSEVDLDPVDSPLVFSPDELAEVVEALALQKGKLTDLPDDPPVPRVPYEKKNQINNMSAEYAKDIGRRFMADTREIYAFLSAPENLELQRLYESIVDELQLKIIAKRKDYQSFDDVMNYLMDLMFERDPVLKQRAHKRLTRAVLFYMYWYCDIGASE